MSMATFTSRLGDFKLDPNAPIYRFEAAPLPPVTLNAPALAVMTDLRRVRVLVIGPEAPLEVAHQLMIHAKVRLLGVVDDSGRLLGVITARDILGEKPLAVATRERIRRDRITVEQIMTPRAQMNPLRLKEVEKATVRDIVMLLREAGRQHAVVVEPREQGDGYQACGIFSITQIGRQLGIDISPEGQVQSFAEVEHLLAEGGSALKGADAIAR
jgi:CBS domain-containing protein